MCYIPDALERYLDKQFQDECEADKMPKCFNCEGLLEDYCYDIDGDLFCEECFNDIFRIDLYEDAICEECGAILDGDTAYKVDGILMCEECVDAAFRITTPDE